jgi:hypothetical protein
MSATQSADVVKVYRVEYPDTGCGPYNPYGDAPYIGDMIAAHGNDPQRPGPFADGEFPDMFDLSTSHYFGFHSWRLFSFWFKGWRSVLQAEGYRLAVYTVPASDVVQGRSQCAFRRDRVLAKEWVDLSRARTVRRPSVPQQLSFW